MSAPLYLSRLTFRKTAEIAPLMRVMQPAIAGDAIETDHRLLWTVMPDEVRDQRQSGDGSAFLWRRDDEAGRYYMLGPRPRKDSSFFDVETRRFEAVLSSGDRLRFVLRVNATVDRRMGGRVGKRERADVAMDLLRPFPPGERSERRSDLAADAAREWFEAKAAVSGFSLQALHLDGYRAIVIRRNPRQPGRIGVFDLQGLLQVTDPDTFLSRLATGFGRAKAFGCGLMLVRRAG